MTSFTAIADDLTGACDVAAEIARTGRRVRVAVDRTARRAHDDGLVIINTQSRALDARMAYARVRDTLGARCAPVVLKKIDTALRGHLGAELDGALDAIGGLAFVLAAIPAAGRVTRGGCQWFGDRWLAETEFARDPEGAGPESSIPVVLARESRRDTAVIGRAVVTAGRLAEVVASHRHDGVEVFIIDAESDADVGAAVTAILSLTRPLCLAGSIALTAALVPHLGGVATAAAAIGLDVGVPLPALIVNGSLHSRSRAQIEAVVATGLAVRMALPPIDDSRADIASLAIAAATVLASGTSVVVVPAVPESVPAAAALRATERTLAEVVTAIADRGPIPTIVLIGGESSHAILMRLRAGMVAIDGRVAPLIARGTIVDGAAAGSVVISKGGSGGEPDIIARLLSPRLHGCR